MQKIMQFVQNICASDKNMVKFSTLLGRYIKPESVKLNSCY